MTGSPTDRPGEIGADRDLYVMDPANPPSDRMMLQVSGGGWGVADWSPDDTKLLATEAISINQTNLWLVDAGSGERTLLAPEPGDTVAYGTVQVQPGRERRLPDL